jgi:Leucine-rich repeat (LRR) protein
MRTKKETGDIVTMTMRANSPATQVEIDFGNGQPETFLLDTAAVAISHVVTGSHNLVVYGNHITSVDVSHNELTDLFVNPDLPLHWFDCSDNLLTGLHVNPEFILQSFFCYNNLFDFSTLPVPRNGWLNYVYAPQHPLEVQPGAEGTEVDLNSQFQVNRIPTLFTWKTKNGNILLENTDYVIANGITTFVSNQPDSVFCEISNPVFCGFVSPDVFQTCMVKVNETEPQMTFAPYLQLCQACSIYPVSFFVRADDENTPIQVDFGDGTLVDILIGKTDTLIEHTVGYKPDLQIIVYGKGISSFRLNNPVISEIDVTANPFLKDLSCGNTLLTKVDLQRNRLLTKLDVTNSSISSLDLHKNLLLQLLHCSNNHLKYLDISNNLALESLDCSLNQLDKIHLFSLENLDTLICTNNVLLALDVTRNPSLSYLQCSGNQLTQLDVTQNKLLTNLTCSFNEIEYIDLKDNALLTEFDCSQNQLNVLDVSRNPNLAYLGCSFNLLTALNLKQNPLLRTFRCVSNALTQLDFSNNDSLKIIDVTFNRIESLELTDMKALTSLSVIENNLTELDLSQNANLTECWYYGNRLTFATLPVPQENWVFCVYAPQQPVFIESGITTGDSIDFSNQFLVREDTTVFVWKDATGNLLIVGTDYMIQNGVTRFLKARIDSVYCEMTNPVFPHFTGDFILKTTKTSISKLTGTTVTEGSEPIILYDNRRCYVRSSFPGEIRIFDITGRLVYRSVLQSGLNEVRPGPSGAYLVTVIGNSSSWSGKIVVD